MAKSKRKRSKRADGSRVEWVQYIDAGLDPEQTDVVMRSVLLDACGFLVGEDDECLTLAIEQMAPFGRNTTKQLRGQLAIPKRSIRRRRSLGRLRR